MKARITRSLLLMALLVLLFLSLVPFVLMLLLSLKSNADIFTNFWGLPEKPRWDFYVSAAKSLWPFLANTLKIILLVVPGVLFLSSLAGYALSRLRFPGREWIANAILALLMVPGILTLIPVYAVVKELNLLNTPWALILPYLAGSQVLGVALSRTFLLGLAEDLFEAMRLDGANDWQIYRYLALPLSLPTLTTIGIMTTLGIYNDYIWPLIALSDNSMQTFTVGVTRFSGEFNMEYGPTLAGYVLGSLPLIVLFTLGMRAFVQGVTAGATKG